MDTLLQDLRYTLRNLARTPGFTLAAVLALALGIGANSAIFSAVDAILLRPLPLPQSEQLVAVQGWDARRSTPTNSVSRPDFADLRAQTRTLSGLAAWTDYGFNLNEGELPERLEGAIVSSNLFDVVG